ncbi:MAG: UDP-N-acetylmuramoyl-tripeptide--D-alanyl-D-alanine ligase, partial [Rhodospirillales bacterium]
MTEPLWTASAAIAAMEGTADRQDWSASGISIDSRTVAPGDLFIAIVGPHFDGHNFVAAALASGAVAAVVTARPDDVPADAALVIVDDTLRAIERLGRAARARTGARVIAVTGSVGKTGTKETLRNILSCYGETHANPGSFNNHWGLPLTLARMPKSTEFAVLELGMNHAGELGPLSRMARPHIALITTIASNHIGNFTSLDGIADAKAEVFEGLEPDGWAILNHDDGYRDRLAAAAEKLGARHIVSFGRQRGATVQLLHCDLKPDSCRVTASLGGLPLTWDVGCAGAHWAMNSLGIMAVMQALSLNFREAIAALARMQPPAGRGERSIISLPDGKAELIDDSYNASPVSMRAAFYVLKGAAPG